MDKIPQKTAMVQASLENESIHKSLLNQKGSFLLILAVVVIILVVLGAGAYYLLGTKGKQSSNVLLAWKKGTPFLINIQAGAIQELNLTNHSIENLHMYANDIQKYYNPSFSPDKKWIIFESKGDIWKIGTDGKDLKQLTFQSIDTTSEKLGTRTSNPRVSPNGRYIYYQISYYSGEEGEGPPTQKQKNKPNIESGYWMIDFGGNTPKFLLDLEYPVDWMPDNKRIIFISKGKTYTYNTEDNKRSPLFDYGIDSLSWSQDGSKAVYFANDELYLADSNFNIVATLPRRKEVTALSTSSKTEEFLQLATISPDGKYVLVTKPFILYAKSGSQMFGDEVNDYKFKVPVFLWDTATKQEIMLPIFFSSHTVPFWSKDSKKIIYVRERLVPDQPSHYSEFGDIFVYNLDSKKEMQLTTSQDFHPYDIVF